VKQEAKQRRTDIAVLAGLAALTLLFFWKIVLTNKVLAGLDVLAYFCPYRDYVSEVLRSGQLPLWNPYLFMGAPLLGNSQAAVLYPLHWPFIWLSAPKQVAWSIVLHVWLAAAGTYLFARRGLKLGPLASLTAAAIFACGGFLGAQVEHLNQINTSAWFPWLLLCLEGAMERRRRCLALLGGGAIVGLILLAGHSQAAYIVLFGAALYALFRKLRGLRGLNWRHSLSGLAALAGLAGMGLVLATGQLLPTLELSRLSVRSGGLPYREAASFSLKPGLIFKAFLPPFFWEPPFSEYVAYVGLLGLALAAVGIWATFRRQRRGSVALLLALVGLFLAFGAYNPFYYVLYRLVPGFALFRAPARWLLLYSFGTAILAGIGLEALPRWGRWKWAIALLVVVELFVSSRKLAYNQPTAPAAFDSLRSATAHLLTDGGAAPTATPGAHLFRFLSMSNIRYDPGDLGDIQAMYASELPEEAIYDLIVATKMKEVLAYNLPLRYRLFSVDGYDGGLLPIKNYVTLERLFLPEEDIWPDGRLRQQLRRIPPTRLLSLLNVKYVITDKTQDAWIDGVFYDLEHTLPLGQITLDDLPQFETTHLGLVSYLTDTLEVSAGTPVAQVRLTARQGAPVMMTLYAGEDTAEGLYDSSQPAHSQAPVGHRWRDNEAGQDYVTVLALGCSLQPEEITIRSLLPGERFHLRGLTLIDDQSGTSRNLSIDPAYRLVHSGDVKIYENLDVLPRAFVVHEADVVADEEAALKRLANAAFDPAQEVILSQGATSHEAPARSNVEFVSYRPEEIRLRVETDAPGYLVLTDTYYPGWIAQVDGQPAPIRRAYLYFRAVRLDSGDHQVAFLYRPASTRRGLQASLVAWLIWGLAFVVCAIRFGRKETTGV